MAFDTGMAPAVGRQVTLAGPASAFERDFLATLATRAGVGDCDLVARAVHDGSERGWLLENGSFRADVAAEASVLTDELLAKASAGGPLTLTCVPPGDGRRSALDRDGDGCFNGDERAAGSDPADPASYPGQVATATPPHETPTVLPVAWPGVIYRPWLER